MYLAFAIAGTAARPLTQEVMRAAQAQEKILERPDELISPLVEFFNQPPYVAVMSRGADLSTVYQGALILKEVVRLAAEPISAAQFRHGPIEIINPSHRYLIVARQGRTAKLLLRLASDICKESGRVMLFTDIPSKPFTNLRLVQVEPLRLGLGTLVDSVYIQLLAHEAALRAGLEPGKFEIAQGVTRKE
jgi:glucosamine--fructose-6-phosphate aminotransferase (isomerizing)